MSIARHTVFEPVIRSTGLSGTVVSRVVSAVLEGKLKEGDRLIVQKLADQMGVSATPVREALVSLAESGLVDLLPNRGAICRPFGIQQLREIYQVRRILESEATLCACDQLDEAELADLRRTMAARLEQDQTGPTWSQQVMASDRQLHEMIAEHCGSERLRHEIARYRMLMQVIRQHAANRLDVQRRAMGEHIEIIDALLDRNPALAAQRMADHIRKTGRDVELLMFPDGSDAISPSGTTVNQLAVKR
jgi:DNA-binding GntR family transcriptional regulator